MRLWESRPKRKDIGPRGSPDKRLYAIGDVHGCYAEMVRLLEMIERDNSVRERRACHIVFLGDLIDRGPGSAQVLQYLRERPPSFARLHFIKGNHEEMMVRCLSGEPQLIPAWLKHGGNTCAMSYGVDPSILADSDPVRLEHTLLSHIPQQDIDFLGGFVDQVRFGDFLLVHAGIRPGIPIEAQSGRDLRWIRAEFLNSDARHEAMIVHGHTITEGVVKRPNRIGLDTGAYRTGILSALRIEDHETAVLMTDASA